MICDDVKPVIETLLLSDLSSIAVSDSSEMIGDAIAGPKMIRCQKLSCFQEFAAPAHKPYSPAVLFKLSLSGKRIQYGPATSMDVIR